MEKKMAIVFIIIGLISFCISIYYLTKSTNNNNKGYDFEDYTIQLICQNKEVSFFGKTCDYHKNGISAKENSEPDLKFEYNNYNFAVECKYRTGFYKGKIDWANQQNIDNYNKYQKKKTSKVFVAIGIGGTAKNPSRVFLVPLNRLTLEIATEKYIREFEVLSNEDIMKTINEYLSK